MLAQFLEDAFSAAQASGAAAILPYEFIPHGYKYNSSLYGFGTDSAAYTSGVAAMYQYQAQRVNPISACHVWHSTPYAPGTHDGNAHQAHDHCGQPLSAVVRPVADALTPNTLIQPRQVMHDALACRCGCARGVAYMQAHARRCIKHAPTPSLGNPPSALGDAEGHEWCRSLLIGRAQTRNCSSGACPAPAPPCQCYDVPPSSTFEDGNDYSGHTCGQLITLPGHPHVPPSPGFCDISFLRCMPCPEYDYCAFCTDNLRGSIFSGEFASCQQLARPVACIHHEHFRMSCSSAALSLLRRSSHVSAEGT